MKNRMNISKSIKHIIGAVCISSTFMGAASADVMMHAFNWNYADVASKAEEISDLGYSSVLVSPPYLSNSSTQWWARYQPLDYRIILSPLGDKNDFENMINQLQSKGVNLYVDVIFNHMANIGQSKGAESYPGMDVTGQQFQDNRLYGDLTQGLFGPGDFHDGSGAKCISNYSDFGDSTWNRLCGAAPDVGLPDLKGESTDGSGEWIRSNQIAYLNALKALGVSGFRIDAVKHMRWEHVNGVFNSDVLNDTHVFAEIIAHSQADDNTYLQPFLNNTDSRFGAYDFRLFNELDHALDSNGSMSNLANPSQLPNSRAITFAITHDMPQNDGFNGFLFSETDENLAYAYILGRDGGIPLVYTDHNETSKFNSRWVNAYKSNNTKNMIAFHNTVQGSEMQVLSSDNCAIYFRRGDSGLVGINKCGNAVSHSINVNGLSVGSYTDTISGNALSISGSQQSVTIPARSARMWLSSGVQPTSNWFFSGTANNWTASQMTEVNGKFEIEMTFANGDANGAPRYKIRDSATDWDVNFPAEDAIVNANNTYKITFDPVSQSTSATPVITSGDYCPVTFTCNNGQTQPGDSVYVVGNIAALSNWDSSSATKLNPDNYPTWSGTIDLPKNIDVSWKCIIRDENAPFAVTQWEVDPNNSFNTGNCNVNTATGNF